MTTTDTPTARVPVMVTEPTITSHDDGRITIEGCDPDEVYPCAGGVMLWLIESHNRLVDELEAVRT